VPLKSPRVTSVVLSGEYPLCSPVKAWHTPPMTEANYIASWRQRAAEARIKAERMAFDEARLALNSLAESYENLASFVERASGVNAQGVRAPQAPPSH
jgi:hypothetical protein